MADEPVTPTVLALDGLREYASDAQRERVAAARERGLVWLRSAKPRSTAGHVMRLWGLDRAGEEVEVARRTVLHAQRPDGGWGQTDEMPSDAFATGQAVYVLLETGTPADDESIRRGVSFLIRSQKPDGSWHVKTRARPVQQYFDNGDPHGRDQFISTPATAWSVTALTTWSARSRRWWR